MSVRTLKNNAFSNTDVVAKTFAPDPAPAPWVRSPSWPAVEADVGDNRLQGLYAVWPLAGNFIALNCPGAAYTVNFGDGTTTNYGGVQANYAYDYSNPALAGTDAPVTFTDSTDTVGRTAHGYTDGMVVQFYNIVSTTGITSGQRYFVINATANTFQISNTLGGTAVALTTNGTGTLLPYKLAIVTITPQAGSSITNLQLLIKHTQTGLVNGASTGWLDLAIALPACAALTIGGGGTLTIQRSLQRVRIRELGGISSFSGLFHNCSQLQNVEIADTITTVVNASSMFSNCMSLQAAPLFNTGAVTNMSSMFFECISLTDVPAYNAANVTTMLSMFSGCRALRTVPLFNTAAVTNMSQMFQNSGALQSVPLFNTAAVTNMSTAFSGCVALEDVPLFNTAAVTNMTSMFNNCSALKTVPLFNTAAVTTMASMFNFCAALEDVPLFNTANVTDMSNMFNSCRALQVVPAFNAAKANTMAGMFNSCSSLKTVPPLTCPMISTMFNMFANCTSLVKAPAILSGTPSNTSTMFASCTALEEVPFFNTNSVTNASSMFSFCSSLKTVPAFSFNGITIGSSITSLFNITPSITRILAINYRVSFSVASCSLSAAALNEIYTLLPVRTGLTITVTGNFGTLTDNPAIATAKGWTVTG